VVNRGLRARALIAALVVLACQSAADDHRASAGGGGGLAGSGGAHEGSGASAGGGAPGGVSGTAGKGSASGTSGHTTSGGASGSGGEAAAGAGSQNLLLGADATGRFLVDGSGQPFLVWGEAAWTLNSQLGITGQNSYLDDRSSRGNNALLLQLISRYQDNSPNDKEGVAPFSTPGDLATFNAPYFKKAADVVARAGEHGMVVFIAPAWAGYDASQGFFDMLVANGETKVHDYGVAVGKVFKDLDNVVWIMGGDRPSGLINAETSTLYGQLSAGIRSVDSRHLITSHWNFAPGDTPSGDWEDFVSCYDWNGGVQYTQIKDEYDENDAPVVLMEALYELNTAYGYTPQILRLQSIQAVLYGARGSFFGHEGIWHLGANQNLPSQSQGHPYDLNSLGMQHQQKIHALFSTRAWQKLVPDAGNAFVTEGRGNYGDINYVGAAKTPDGSLGIVYIPEGGSITVDLSQLKSPIAGKWFDPTTGSYTDAGSFSSPASHAFTTLGNNASGDSDWVLVLE
jgi:Protein of unknown function (DUF4038)/Putative collagen-binding domain of a collagenase